MSDLKEFLKAKLINSIGDISGNPELDRDLNDDYISVADLGLFFWVRGGKQFVLARDDYEYFPEGTSITALKKVAKLHDNNSDVRDFLDCVDCLGEQRVKELIKELEGKKQ